MESISTKSCLACAACLKLDPPLRNSMTSLCLSFFIYNMEILLVINGITVKIRTIHNIYYMPGTVSISHILAPLNLRNIPVRPRLPFYR